MGPSRKGRECSEGKAKIRQAWRRQSRKGQYKCPSKTKIYNRGLLNLRFPIEAYYYFNSIYLNKYLFSFFHQVPDTVGVLENLRDIERK